jgi:hypothetical protein
MSKCNRARERSPMSDRIAEIATAFGCTRGACGPGSKQTLAFRPVTRYIVTRYKGRDPMTAPAERMKMMRQRRRARGLRELRLVVADARSRAVRRRVAKQVAGLDPDRERDALQWIQSVSEFDADATR